MLLLNILTVPVGGLLWYWGGYGLQPLGKQWRRTVWPVFVGTVLVLNGIPLLKALLVVGLMKATLHLGYGEDKKWSERIAVEAVLGTPFLFLENNLAWPLATLLTFGPLHWLSLKANWMTWPVVEACAGAIQGAIILAILMMR